MGLTSGLNTGSVLNPEAYNVSALLRASGYPFVAVITTTIDNHTTVEPRIHSLNPVCVRERV